MSNQALIQLNSVSQSFKVGEEKVDVLEEITFDIKPGTFNIIFGPSGSGKSTLLNILSGLQQPSAGAVTYEGEDLYGYPSNELAWFRANRIGIVYQQNYWVKSLSVAENVALPLLFMGKSKTEAVARAVKVLDMIKMGQYSRKDPSLLSGGEQQRVAMARALVNSPTLIIADEPTGNLDSKNGDRIMQLLETCHTQLRRTVILVTHNMEYLPLADKLLRMSDGRVEEMVDSGIQTATNQLFNDMKQRINRLAEHRNTEVQGGPVEAI